MSVRFMHLKAQQTQVNLSWNGGVVFFPDKKGGNYRASDGFLFGMNALFFGRKNAMVFKPALGLARNSYTGARTPERTYIEINQTFLAFWPEVMLRVHKNTYLRCGLFFNQLLTSNIDYAYYIGATNTIAYYSNGLYYENYKPVPTQVGIVSGFSHAFKVKKAEMSLNFTAAYHATGIVREDFYNRHMPIPKDRLIMSAAVRPLTLMAGLDIAVKRKEKLKGVPANTSEE